MEHGLFKPKDFNHGKNAVVGDCNGFSMQERYEKETPVFANQILTYLSKIENPQILDYGCGVGRLSKEILEQNPKAFVYGVDASDDMIALSTENLKGIDNCLFTRPEEIVDYEQNFDLVYLIYVLQHVPAIEIRDILSRIHYKLKDDGVFIYCSSDYRMAIRFDQGGFFDDRFLGVDLREEISRFFEEVEPLFDEQTLNDNPVVKTMVQGGLSHPAIVYKKKEIKHYFNTSLAPVKEEIYNIEDVKKILLVNRLSPGDILVMTNAIRDLDLAFPGKYEIDVRTPCQDIFNNNPHITKFSYNENKYNQLIKEFNQLSSGGISSEEHCGWIDDVLVIDMHYPLINVSGRRGSHFSEGHRDFLERVLKVKIPQTDLRPELFLDQTEKSWVSPLILKKGIKDKYWVINSGSKSDYTLKQYPYYQEVINLLKDKITFVQVGVKNHLHSPLENVIDMVGATNHRELMRLVYHAEGVITCVSYPMHIAAAFSKPCIVVAGGRESVRWEYYQGHRYLSANGLLFCCKTDGCWKSKTEDCINIIEGIPKCMTLISSKMIANEVLSHYLGGILSYDN